MKEYKSKTGGRPLYNEDIHNLQELALSMTEFLNGSKLSFVLSGCEITVRNGNGGETTRSISSGYVYLNGKIRHVEARDIGTVPLPVYICERNTDTGNSISYADKTSDEQFIDYEAEIRTSQETLSGQYIEADSDERGFPDVKTSFFNHYSLIKDTDLEQYVKSLTTFGNGIKTALVRLLKSNVSADLTIDTEGNLVITLGNHLDHQYSMVLYRATGELGVNDNGKPVWKMSVNDDGTLNMPPMSMGDIKINGKVDAGDVIAAAIDSASVTTKTLECVDKGSGETYLQSGTEIVDGIGVDEGKWLSPFLKFIGRNGNVTSTMLMHLFGNTMRLGNGDISVDLQLNGTTRQLELNRALKAPSIVSAGDIYENGKKLEDIYLKKATDKVEGDGNGWFNLINANTGEPIPGLMIRNKYDILLQIKGSIPKDLLQYPYGGSSYMARLPIRVPEGFGFGDAEELAIGSSFYSTFNGYNRNIPTNGSNKALFTFVATLNPMGMGGHSSSDTVADCILGVKADRYLYIFGARFQDGCYWNGHHNDGCAPYAKGEVPLNIRTLMT